MNHLAFSSHAETRSQQRGIQPIVVDWLMQYGARQHDHHGAEIYYFDKRSRRSLAKGVGHDIVARLKKLLDAYIVISKDGTVVTVGHRYKRICKH
jgi:hypothetical protein